MLKPQAAVIEDSAPKDPPPHKKFAGKTDPWNFRFPISDFGLSAKSVLENSKRWLTIVVDAGTGLQAQKVDVMPMRVKAALVNQQSEQR